MVQDPGTVARAEWADLVLSPGRFEGWGRLEHAELTTVTMVCLEMVSTSLNAAGYKNQGSVQDVSNSQVPVRQATHSSGPYGQASLKRGRLRFNSREVSKDS